MFIGFSVVVCFVGSVLKIRFMVLDIVKVMFSVV